MIGQFIMISTALEKKVLLRFLLHIAIMTSLLVMMVFVWTLVIGKSLNYPTALLLSATGAIVIQDALI